MCRVIRLSDKITKTIGLAIGLEEKLRIDVGEFRSANLECFRVG